MENCFTDGKFCWQSDYNNQIYIECVKGEKILKDLFLKVSSAIIIERKIVRKMTGYSPSNALNLSSIKPKYDNRFSGDLSELLMLRTRFLV